MLMINVVTTVDSTQNPPSDVVDRFADIVGCETDGIILTQIGPLDHLEWRIWHENCVKSTEDRTTERFRQCSSSSQNYMSKVQTWVVFEFSRKAIGITADHGKNMLPPRDRFVVFAGPSNIGSVIQLSGIIMLVLGIGRH